jgi:hypothetical protein
MKTSQMTGFALLAVGLLSHLTGHAYDKGEGADSLASPPGVAETPPGSSITFAIDNDLMLPGSRDRDYSYGLNLTYAGRTAENMAPALRHSLDWLDLQLGFETGGESSLSTRKVEFGLFGFTPEDITISEPIPGDRPYASLVYVSSTRERYDRDAETSWQSTLTLGVLGLDFVGEVQNFVHDKTSGDRARGWDNQISAGGEPTARYSLSRQTLLYDNAAGFELKSTVQGSVGYLTEAAWSLSLRKGKLQTPWVSFNPELTSYGEKAVSTNGGNVDEHYLWAGIAFKARAYNVFLQGQFRDSALTYDSDEINHGIVEAWVGYSVTFVNGFSLTYSIRGHTAELKEGPGNRSVVWGSLQLARNFR